MQTADYVYLTIIIIRRLSPLRQNLGNREGDVCSQGMLDIKYAALALLVLQNTFLVIFMRYSRTQAGPLYASSTAVFMMEVGCFHFESVIYLGDKICLV